MFCRPASIEEDNTKSDEDETNYHSLKFILIFKPELGILIEFL